MIITPENQKILIDTGPIGKINQKFKKYFPFFDKEIDLFILTHPDSDHIGGIFDILKNYEIKRMILSQNTQNKTAFNNLLQITQQQNIPTLFANQNTDLRINQNLNIDFIYPFTQSTLTEQNSFGNPSLVFKIIYGQTSFFFSGDAEKEEENLITLTSQNLKADIYQAGHHGSKSSSSLSFLQAIQPKITIISAGKENSFGHPHQEVLDRLKQLNSAIYQTAQKGDITILSNGKNFWLK